MKYLLKRVGIIVTVIVVLLVVLRAIVVPLAVQRQGRHDTQLNILSLIPEGTESWTLRRNFFRRLPPQIWPGGSEALERNLAEYDLPLEAVKELLTTSRCWGGEWLGGETADGGWFLVASLARIPRENTAASTLIQKPDTLIAFDQGVLAARGSFLIAASSAELLKLDPWLGRIPDWVELGQLLLSADLLEFRAQEDGGLLQGVKSVQRMLSCESLAWGVTDGAIKLATLAPGPRTEQDATPEELDQLPLMRRSAPFAPDGQPLPVAALRITRRDGLIVGERRWQNDTHAALVRIIFNSDD
ncbi:MAG: hypothetical protein GY835_17590 [bacterium]|nr:hypothetical protein [bacterium]